MRQSASFCPQCGREAPRGIAGGTMLMDPNAAASPGQPQAAPAPNAMPPGAPQQQGWQGGAPQQQGGAPQQQGWQGGAPQQQGWQGGAPQQQGGAPQQQGWQGGAPQQQGWQGGSAAPGGPAPGAAPPWQAGVGVAAAGVAAAALQGGAPAPQQAFQGGGAPQQGFQGGATPAPQQGFQGGAPAPGAATGSGPELRVCTGCGAIAPLQRSDCVRCHTSLASPSIVHDPVSGFWVGLESCFTCSACGHASPLNYLAIDGDVQCLRCGVEQRFEVDQWWDELTLAHTIGDLCGPAPEGRFPLPGAPSIAEHNPYKAIGTDKTFGEHQQGGMVIDASGMHPHTLHIWAMPGHPLCEKCKQPQQVTSCAGGELTLECPSCHDTRTYVRPNGIPQNLQALAAVVAMEHEKGGQHAAVQQDASGAVAIRCPNCAAPLDFDGKSAVIRCKYCEIAVRIPAHTLKSLGQDNPPQLRWWLYFTGVSEKRKDLTRKAEEQANQGGWQAAQGSMPMPQFAPYQPPQRRKKSGGLGAAIGIIPIAGAVLAAGVAFGVSRMDEISTSDSTTTHSRSAAVGKPTPTVKKTYPRFEAHWLAKVTKASGVKLKRGEKCNIAAQLQGPTVHWVTVRCGKTPIYDSRVEASGMMSMNTGVAEEPAKGHPGAYSYALVFSNTGQFTGRPQASIDTTIDQGVIFSTVPPIMRVEMKISQASLPHVGAPMFDTPKSAPHVKWKATVTGSTHGSPVKSGASCSLVVAFADSQEHSTACDATVQCGRHWLYGTKKDEGIGACKVDSSGRPLSIHDKAPTTQDHTPIFDFDASKKIASIVWKNDGYAVTLKLSH